MENRLYAFDWKYIGDMELGRPNLGKTARLEIYRLFQYTLRDVLETEYGNSPTGCYIKRDSSLGQNSANGT